MPALPHGAVALGSDRETAVGFLAALMAALRARRRMGAQVVAPKLYAPFRKLIADLHQWITSLSPAASLDGIAVWYSVQRSWPNQVCAWATYLGLVPSWRT